MNGGLHPAPARKRSGDPYTSPLWLMKLLVQTTKITPWHSLACIVFYVVSQIMFLAALLLPWKMLVILSGQGTSASLSPLFDGWETRPLIVALGLMVILAFIAHFTSELAIDHICRKGAARILGRYQKTGLFDDHRRQSVQIYRRLLRTVAAASCGLLIALVLFGTYFSLFLALSLYSLLSLFALAPIRRLTDNKAEQLGAEMPARLWWSVGFLYLIGWVLWDYGEGRLPALTAAFLGLILARQSLIFQTQIFQNFRFLGRQRQKVEALFLPHMPYSAPAPVDHDLQAFIGMGRERGWIAAVLRRYQSTFSEHFAVEIRTAEAGRVLYLIIRLEEAAADDKAFMLKLFHKSRQALAEHEYAALMVADAFWPAPRLLGSHLVQEHHCLVFEDRQSANWLTAKARIAALLSLRELLFACRIKDELKQRYLRSHFDLAQQLEQIDWQLLTTLSTTQEERDNCRFLCASWPAILAMVADMPHHLVLPKLDLRMMRATSDDAVPQICNWTRWQLEPLGAGWPFRQRPLPHLEATLQKAAGLRAELKDISANDVFLIAVLFEFNRLNASANFAGMLNLTELMRDHAQISCAPNQNIGSFIENTGIFKLPLSEKI